MNLDALWVAWPEDARVQSVAVFGASVLVALLVLVLFHRIVHRLAARTATELDDIAADAVRRPVAATVVGVGAWFAVHHWGLPELAVWLLSGLLLTALALHWASSLAHGAGRLLDWLAQHQDHFDLITPRTLPVFDIGAKTVIYGGAAYFVLLAWRVDVTGWLASAGIVGVAIGFASQDTLSNLIAGVFILADAPYKLGDYLVLDNGDRGAVVEIGIRTTRLMTRDDVEIIVPNKVMANARIINQSGGPVEAFRVRVAVGVAYGSDIDLVHRVLDEIARTTAGVRTEPAPRVRFRAFGDSSLDHELLVWVDAPSERGLVTHELLTTIYKRFAAEGVEIPFPKRDVYLHRVPDED
ncbi:MAG: mechanosensitive ion channel [Myxococcota bacterium]